METVLATMPPPVVAALEPKIKEYRGGYGTVGCPSGGIVALTFLLTLCSFSSRRRKYRRLRGGKEGLMGSTGPVPGGPRS